VDNLAGASGGTATTRKQQTHPEDMMEGRNDYSDDEEEAFSENKRPVLEIPRGLCRGTMKHYAHQSCLQALQQEYRATRSVVCPRCLDLQSRTGYRPSGNLSQPQQTYYCANANIPQFPQGFVGSPKLDAVMEWVQSVPNTDKMMILSFFKGGLDLVEGILHYDWGMETARFDGDVSADEKQRELDRFQNDPNCRVLLMTVQSGGVGLNIVQANHVAFLDRWYNPFVQEQAEDRCHRLGQTKNVFIQYFDCNSTIDQAMVEINHVKYNNSKILLSDGFEVGTNGSKRISYTELTGLITGLIRTIQAHRRGFVAEQPGNERVPIPTADDAIRAHVWEHQQRQSRGVRGSSHGVTAGRH